jgi:hypothetical protein
MPSASSKSTRKNRTYNSTTSASRERGGPDQTAGLLGGQALGAGLVRVYRRAEDLAEGVDKNVAQAYGVDVEAAAAGQDVGARGLPVAAIRGHDGHSVIPACASKID